MNENMPTTRNMSSLPPSTPLLSAVKFSPINSSKPSLPRVASKLAFRKNFGVNVSMTSIGNREGESARKRKKKKTLLSKHVSYLCFRFNNEFIEEV